MIGAGPSTQTAPLTAHAACLGGPSLASRASAPSWALPQKYHTTQAGHLLKMRNKDVHERGRCLVTAPIGSPRALQANLSGAREAGLQTSCNRDLTSTLLAGPETGTLKT